MAGDPVTPMAVVGRSTTRIELGTAVLQTYTAHPVLQGHRAAAAAMVMGRPGFTLGLGPSHAPVIEGMFGMSYATPGRHTEEYVEIVAALLRGEAVDVAGDELTLRGVPAQPIAQPVQLLVAALAPRLLRVAGAVADGTILWMGNARAVETHVAPRLAAAAAAAGRPAPRVVAGLPVAVHDDVAEARAVAAKQFAIYGTAAELPADPRRTAASTVRPMRRSSATRRPSPRACRGWSMPGRPTSGRRSSPSATTPPARAGGPGHCSRSWPAPEWCCGPPAIREGEHP